MVAVLGDRDGDSAAGCSTQGDRECDLAMKCAWILAFWALSVTAHLCFKFGTTAEARWWPFFVLGNVFSITAALTLMNVYTTTNPNVALGLCVGGGFLLAQTTIYLVFHSSLSWPQVVGILAIAVGMALLAAPPSVVEQGAAPNGGSATQLGNSGVTGGPPSVS